MSVPLGNETVYLNLADFLCGIKSDACDLVSSLVAWQLG